MYSNPGFMAGVGVMAFTTLFGLFYLVAARRRARTIRVLEQRGRAVDVEVTNIRFKALNRLGSSYGLVSFTYEYEGKVLKHKQAIEDFNAYDLLRRSAHPCVLVLPERPRCAKLAYNEKIVYDDPTIRNHTLTGILLVLLYPVMALVAGFWFLMLR